MSALIRGVFASRGVAKAELAGVAKAAKTEAAGGAKAEVAAGAKAEVHASGGGRTQPHSAPHEAPHVKDPTGSIATSGNVARQERWRAAKAFAPAVTVGLVGNEAMAFYREFKTDATNLMEKPLGAIEEALHGLPGLLAGLEAGANRAVGNIGLPSSVTGAAEGLFAIAAIGGTVYVVYEGYRFFHRA